MKTVKDVKDVSSALKVVSEVNSDWTGHAVLEIHVLV